MKGVFVHSLLLIFLSLQANGSIYYRQQQNSVTPSQALTSSAPTSTTPADSTSKSTDPTSTVASQSTTPTSSSTTTTTQSSAPSSSTQTAAPPPLSASTTADVVQLTTSNGVQVTVTITGATSSSSTAQGLPSQTNSPSDSSGLGTGSIIGMAVAGGVTVIGIIAFFVWKFTRKRFSDLDGDEAIKWPDLNTHGGGELSSHPLPVHNTGRAGFDTGSEGSLSRVNSATNDSTADFNNAVQDPYAVPPLPHLNPNQPYRDDPGVAAGYYDPYRGPVPGTIEPGAPEWTGEAIPMTQLGAGGRMSPGPQAAYGAGGMEQAQVYDAGRQSPAPYAAYGGRTPSPGPQAAYGGRMSPGPHAAYGAAPPPPVNYEGYQTR